MKTMGEQLKELLDEVEEDRCKKHPEHAEANCPVCSHEEDNGERNHEGVY